MRTLEAEVRELQRRAESAREVAERALRRARQALAESERSRRDAQAGQLAAEWDEMIATAAWQAAEEARDAAEEGRAVAELAAREAQLAQHNLQNVLAMAAHDLYNPVSGILGYAQLLQRRQASPTLRAHALSAVERSALQMSRLIQDLVDAGNAGSGTFSLRLKSTDLAALGHQVAERLGQGSTRHRILVDAPERVVGSWDADRLGQVVTNLVANAIRYSPEGGEIGVQVRSDNDIATVRVTDQGIGIRDEDLHLLFLPFSRLSDGAKLGGTGLGLYISHGIVAAHGGRISVESAGPRTGTTFTVRLPLGGPSGTIRPVETDDRQRQNAMLAERDSGSVASALAAFRNRRGFERSSLAAWLGLSPDRLVALTLERRPDPTDPSSEAAVAVLAERYGADPTRLTEALAG